MSAKMRILAAAARIRMRRGMALEDILISWPELTAEEKENIRNAVR